MLGHTTTSHAHTLTDEEVLARARKEPWLFAVLLDRYQDAFLRKARTVLRTEEDAEEVVQDTFTKIYMHADKFEARDTASFSSWGYRILMNTACTQYQKCLRDAKRYVPAEPDFLERVAVDKTHHVGFSLTRDAIERVLNRLPGHFAHVLRLHYLDRWSQQDIASSTGESVGTIKARIHRAKVAFKKEATGQEVELLLQ